MRKLFNSYFFRHCEGRTRSKPIIGIGKIASSRNAGFAMTVLSGTIGFLAMTFLFCSISFASQNVTNQTQNKSGIDFSKFPIYFIPNQGQVKEKEVKYYGTAGKAAFYFTEQGAVYSFIHETVNPKSKIKNPKQDKNKTPEYRVENIKLNYVGANKDPRMEGEEKLETKFNYYVGGNKDDYKTNLPSYAKVRYKNIYDGIDLIYGSQKGQLKSEFIVKPHKDANKIQIEYEEIKKLEINKNGDLVIKTESGQLIEKAPYAYQDINGKRIEIKVKYKLINGNGSSRTYAFQLGDYDNDYKLIIDPALEFVHYIGGTGSDIVRAIVVDPDGYSYVTGWTDSSDFTNINNGKTNLFIAKINITGNKIIWKYISSGSRNEMSYCIAIDDQKSVYVGGSAANWSFNYRKSGGLVIKLDANGNLVYKKIITEPEPYVLWSRPEHAVDRGIADSFEYAEFGIAVDANHNAYVVGNNYRIVTPDHLHQTGFGWNEYTETFPDGRSTHLKYGNNIYKISPGGEVSIYSTITSFSTKNLELNGISIDKYNSDIVWVTGFFNLPSKYLYHEKIYVGGGEWNYFRGGHVEEHFGSIPVAKIEGLPYDTNNAFAAKLKSNSTLNFGTKRNQGQYEAVDLIMQKSDGKYEAVSPFNYVVFFLGGTSGNSVAVDTGSNAYVVGQAGNTTFVSKISPNMSNVYYVSLRANSLNQRQSIVADNDGNAYVVTNDYYKILYAKLDAGGNISHTAILGGNSADLACGIGIDRYKNVYIGGQTYSSDFSTHWNSDLVRFNSAAEKIFGFNKGNGDGFLLRLSYLEPPSDFQGRAIATDAISYTWTKNSNNEIGFEMLDENRNRVMNLSANTAATIERGLIDNTKYIRTLVVYNSSIRFSNTLPIYSLIKPPGGANFGEITASSIQIYPKNSLNNIGQKDSGARFEAVEYHETGDIPHTSGWIKNNSYTFTNLQPNTRCVFNLFARNGDQIESTPSYGSDDGTFKYTLAKVPILNAEANWSETNGYYCSLSINSNGNPAYTKYSITPDDGKTWLQADGTASINKETAFSKISDKTWFYKNLKPGTEYTFKIAARNEDRIETELSSAKTTTKNLKPSVILSAVPQIIGEGDPVILTWKSNPLADSVSFSNFETEGQVTGHATIYPSLTTTYEISVINNSNLMKGSSSVIVTVLPPIPDEFSVNLTAVPSNIKKGKSSELSWSSKKATGVLWATPPISGLTGATSVSPQETTNYSITVKDSKGNSKSSNVTVYVDPLSPQVSLTAVPNIIDKGGVSTLHWSSENATDFVSATFNAEGGLSGYASVMPTVTTEYKITVQDDEGNLGVGTATVSVNGSTSPEPIASIIITEQQVKAPKLTITAKSTVSLKYDWIDFNTTVESFSLLGENDIPIANFGKDIKTTTSWTINPSEGEKLRPNTLYTRKIQVKTATGVATSVAVTTYTSMEYPSSISFPFKNQSTTCSIEAAGLSNLTSDNSGILFKIRNLNLQKSSGWIHENHYNFTGLTGNTTYEFTMMARNGDGIDSYKMDLSPMVSNMEMTTGEAREIEVDRLSLTLFPTPTNFSVGSTALLVEISKEAFPKDAQGKVIWPDVNDSNWAKQTKWSFGSLDPNTRYYFKKSGKDLANKLNYTSAGDTTQESFYTSIETSTGITFVGLATNEVTVHSRNEPSNLASGESGILFEISPATNAFYYSGWQKNNAWRFSGLEPNTPYTFSIITRNADPLQRDPYSETKYTLIDPPIGATYGVLRKFYEDGLDWFNELTEYLQDEPTKITIKVRNEPSNLASGKSGILFEKLSPGEYASSEWRQSNTYTFSGLESNTLNTFRITTRNGSEEIGGTVEGLTKYTAIETPSGISFEGNSTNEVTVHSFNEPSHLDSGLSGIKFFNITTASESAWLKNNSYTFSGLSPNTCFRFGITTRNGTGEIKTTREVVDIYTIDNTQGYLYGVSKSLTTEVILCTSIEAPSGATWEGITSSSIIIHSSNGPSNLSLGNSGILFERTNPLARSGSDWIMPSSGWKQTNTWQHTGLSPNTQYTFRVTTRNASQEVEGTLEGVTKYTLAATPEAPTVWGSWDAVDNYKVQIRINPNNNPTGTEYAVTTDEGVGWINRDTKTGTTETKWNSNLAGWEYKNLTSNTTYNIRVKARNTDLIETTLSSTSSAITPSIQMTPPGNFTVTSESENQLRYRWTDNTTNETGFRILDTSGNVKVLVNANVTTTIETGLATNTAYARKIEVYEGSNRVTGETITRYTSIEASGGGTYEGISTGNITIHSSNNPTNLSSGESAIIFRNVTKNTSVETQSNVWANSGLSANTAYNYSITTKNGDGIIRSTIDAGTKYTSIEAPEIATWEITTGSIKVYASSWWSSFNNLSSGESGIYFRNVTAETNSTYINTNTWTSSPLTKNASYEFSITTKNGEGLIGGTLSGISRYTSAETPLAPTVIGTVDAENNFNCRVTVNGNGNPGYTEYALTTDEGNSWLDWDTKNTSTNTYWKATTEGWIYADLLRNTTYSIRVKARNGNQVETTLSATASATTPLVSYLEAPTNFTALPNSTTSLTYRWIDNASNEQGFRILDGDNNNIGAVGANTTTITEGYMDVNTAYTRKIQAYNSGGVVTSTAVTKYTSIESPGTATYEGVATNEVTIHSGNDFTNIITGESGLLFEKLRPGVLVSSETNPWRKSNGYTFGSLSANTQYDFRISSRNGNGLVSGILETNRFTKIEAPLGATYESVTTNSITIHASNEISNLVTGESGILFERTSPLLLSGSDYVIPTSGWIKTNTWTHSDLSPNKQYTFRITTRNGTSEIGGTKEGLTKYTLAAIPNTPTVNGSWDATLGYNVAIKISANSNPSGTYYAVTTDEGISWLDRDTKTTTSEVKWNNNLTGWIYKNLSSNTTYSIRVKAKNGEDVETTLSATSSARTPSSTITPPSNFTIVTESPTQLRYRWTDNTTNESGFRILEDETNGPSSSVEKVLVTANGTTTIETGLATNTAYARRGEVYVGSDRATSDAVTKYTSIEAATGATYEGVTSTTITIYASSEPSNLSLNPLDPLNYTGILFTNENTGLSSPWMKTNGAVNRSLTPNTSYAFSIATRNGDGEIRGTTEVGSKYTLAATPEAPTLLGSWDAVNGYNIVITVNRNGNPVNSTNYAVTTNEGVSWIDKTTGTATTETKWGTGESGWVYKNLSANTIYSFRVKAKNGENIETTLSGTASATTPSATITPPSNFNATPESTTSLRYTWTDNANNETGFQLLDEYNNVAVIIGTADAVTTVETGLATNTAYTRKLEVYNTNGAATSETITKYSGIDVPISATYEGITTGSITIHAGSNPSNLSTGESGILFANVGKVTNSPWSNNNTWTSSSLSTNTQYTFRMTTKNGDGVVAGTLEVLKYTSIEAPVSATFETGTKNIKIYLNANLTNLASGESGIKFFNLTTSKESDWQHSNGWISGGLSGSTTYRFRIETRNGDGEIGGTYEVDNATSLEILSATWEVTSSSITAHLNNEPINIALGQSGILFENITTGGASVWTKNNSGISTGLSPNKRYQFRIRIRDENGLITSTMEGLYKYTLPNVPSLPTVNGSWDADNGYNVPIIVNTNDNPTGTYYGVSVDRSGIIWLKRNGELTTEADWSQSTTGWTYKNLQADTIYYFRVKARNLDNEETTLSATASARTPRTAITPPSNFSVITESPTQLRYRWSDNTTNESGFRILDGSDNVKISLSANVVTTVETGLATNAAYTRKAEVYTSNDSATSGAVTKYTSIEVSTGGRYSINSTNEVTIYSINTPSNLTQGISGIKFTNITTSLESDWLHSNGITNTSLSPNRRYAFNISTRNGDGEIRGTADGGGKYTAIERAYGATYETAATSITIHSSNEPSNLASGESGILFENTNIGTNSGWVKTNTWINSSLTANTQYTYKITTRNGDGLVLGTLEGIAGLKKYTLANIPSAPTVNGSWDATNGFNVRIRIGTNNNPINTNYAVTTDEGVSWIQNDGTSSSTIYWSTSTSGWMYKNLARDTAYNFKVKAKNGDSVETALSGGSTAQTPAVAIMPPINFNMEAETTNSMRYSWSDPTTNEAGFRVLDENNNVKVLTLPNVLITVEATGLSTNTAYTRKAEVYTTEGRATTESLTRYTSIETVTGATWEVTTTTIKIYSNIEPTNLNLGASGMLFTNKTKDRDSTWIRGNGWTSEGLTINTQYGFSIKTSNGNGMTTASYEVNRYTSAEVPAVPTVTGSWDATNNYNVMVRINGNNNPNNTEYAVTTDEGNSWLDRSTQTTTTTKYWNTNTTGWVYKNLIRNTSYSFRVKARNGDNVETTLSGTSSAVTPNAELTAPSNFNMIAESISQFRYTWTDSATNESGYRILDNSGNEKITMAAGTNLMTTTESNLLTNTAYERKIEVFNSEGRVTSESVTRYTSIETVLTGTYEGITTSGITIHGSNDISNLSSGESGMLFENTTIGITSGWVRANGWANSGLSKNTKYAFKITTRNGDGVIGGTKEGLLRYSGIEISTGGTFEGITINSITIRSSNEPTNLALDSSGIMFENTTIGTTSGWIQTNTWINNNLTANKQYTYRITTRNGDGVIGGTKEGITKYTAIELPVNATWEAGTTWIRLYARPTLSNLTSGESAVLFENITTGIPSGWIKVDRANSIGLSPNMKYEFKITTRNGEGIIAGTKDGLSKYTLAATPMIGRILASFDAVNGYYTPIVVDPNGNPDNTRYAVTIDNGATWLAPNGELRSMPFWSTLKNWVYRNLVADTQYTYRVKAINEEGIETPLSAIGMVNMLAPTAAPLNCYLDNIAKNSMRINWTDNNNNEQGYSIEKSIDEINYKEVGRTAANEIGYEGIGVKGLDINNEYWYRVRAFGEVGYSPYAIAKPRWTLAATPDAHAYTNVTTTVIKANFGKSGNPDYTSYYFENLTSGTNSGWITGESWPSRNLKEETEYRLRVKAKNMEAVETGWTDLGIQKTKPARIERGMRGDGKLLISRDKIKDKFKLSFTIAGGSGLDIQTFKLWIDEKEIGNGTKGDYDEFVEAGGVGTIEYQVKNSLTKGMHEVRAEIMDTDGTIYRFEKTALEVVNGRRGIEGSVLVYPNPFDPYKGNLKISYTLGNDMDVSVFIFNINGELVWRNRYMSGGKGGSLGYNEVEWNGIGIFGQMMENDAYLIRIVDESGRNVMGKTNVMILKGTTQKEDKKKGDLAQILLLSMVGIISAGGLWNIYRITRNIRK